MDTCNSAECRQNHKRMESDSDERDMEDEMIGYLDKAPIKDCFLAEFEDKIYKLDRPDLVVEVKEFESLISCEWIAKTTQELNDDKGRTIDMEIYATQKIPWNIREILDVK